MDAQDKKFRFETREEYEREMTAIITRSVSSSHVIDDAEYEELAEEFIMFCDEKED